MSIRRSLAPGGVIDQPSETPTNLNPGGNPPSISWRVID